MNVSREAGGVIFAELQGAAWMAFRNAAIPADWAVF
jgi:hypothetical protein